MIKGHSNHRAEAETRLKIKTKRKKKITLTFNMDAALFVLGAARCVEMGKNPKEPSKT